MRRWKSAVPTNEVPALICYMLLSLEFLWKQFTVGKWWLLDALDNKPLLVIWKIQFQFLWTYTGICLPWVSFHFLLCGTCHEPATWCPYTYLPPGVLTFTCCPYMYLSCGIPFYFLGYTQWCSGVTTGRWCDGEQNDHLWCQELILVRHVQGNHPHCCTVALAHSTGVLIPATCCPFPWHLDLSTFWPESL